MNVHKEKQDSKSKRKLIFLLLVFAVIVCCIGLMLQPRSDWRMIGFGTLAFVGGSASLVWIKEWKEGKLKLLKAILIPILLAAGGLLTTHGWNLRDNYFNDRARLVAMAAELHLNQIRIEILSISYSAYETTGNQEEMTALSLPSSHQVRQVLSFSDIQRNDATLADMVVKYVFAADLLNAKLEQIDRVCSNHIVRRETANRIIQSAFGKNYLFDAFRNIHKQLAGHITAKYSWCFEEAGIKIRKPMMDAFYFAIANRWMQLSSFEHNRRMKRLRDVMQQQGILIPIPPEDPNSQTALDPNN